MNKILFKHIPITKSICGNGELTWPEVKAIIEPILDDRFIVMTYEG